MSVARFQSNFINETGGGTDLFHRPYLLVVKDLVGSDFQVLWEVDEGLKKH